LVGLLQISALEKVHQRPGEPRQPFDRSDKLVPLGLVRTCELDNDLSRAERGCIAEGIHIVTLLS
jgi:hypothetical protein